MSLKKKQRQKAYHFISKRWKNIIKNRINPWTLSLFRAAQNIKIIGFLLIFLGTSKLQYCRRAELSCG